MATQQAACLLIPILIKPVKTELKCMSKLLSVNVGVIGQ